MLNINEAVISELIFHRYSKDETLLFENNTTYEYDGDEENILKNIFLKPFATTPITYEFKHDINLSLNPLFVSARSIYNGDSIVGISKHILSHLRSTSKHPNIKDGDLFVVKYRDVQYENTFYEALGLYKIENKESFIQVNEISGLKFQQGIGTKKIDKACLILFSNEPYTVFIIDNISKDTEYWINDFLNLHPKSDNINNTNQFLQLTQSYIKHEYPQYCDSKADQVDLLNRSIQYFKDQDTFNIDDFTREVIGKPEVIDSFNQYKEDYKHDQNLNIDNQFTIADAVVKKQARAFKNVIKLDKNFHIYVHGSRDLIEQGEDNRGRFYKVYFKEEY